MKENQTIELKGWVQNKRGSNKIKFIEFRNNAKLIQLVAKSDVTKNFKQIDELNQESAIQIKGIVKKQKSGDFEIELLEYYLISDSIDYPISNKEHGEDFLMSNRHLWIRSKKQNAILKIRSKLKVEIFNFFDQERFYNFDAPIITSTSGEGGSELFKFSYFDKIAYLSQTGQLYAEAGIYSLEKVFTFGPIFRAEKSRTKKHANEFWMLEAEMAFTNQKQNEDFQEKFVKHMIKFSIDNLKEELNILNRDTDLLENYLKNDFIRLNYKDAVKLLNDNNFDDIKDGDDLSTTHENFITEYYKLPVFLQDFPKNIKAFYMHEKKEDPKYVLCADLLVPEGFGELIGGSQRIEDYDFLVQKMKEENLDLKDYDWYLDLRKYGSVEHSGFGIGFERLVGFISGAEHIRETLPFGRFPNRINP